jgi:hypothetical protein
MLAMCYKSYEIDPCLAVGYPIHHAPDRLQNPRETKAFAIESRAGKWSIATVQIGNNFAHTVRSGAAGIAYFFHGDSRDFRRCRS